MNYLEKQQIFFFICCITLGLTGCVDLSGAKLTPEKKVAYHSNKSLKSSSQKKKTNRSKSQGEVHTMLGGLGMFSVGMNTVRDDIAKQYKSVSASSNMWYNAGDVTKAITHYYYTHKIHRPIILMGHSLGANEQIKVARNLNAAGVPVELLVTVDAVSQTIVPPNVKHVLNVYKPGYIPMFSGLRLKAVDPNATRIKNINVDNLKELNVNHFTIDKDKVVQAMILDEVKRVIIDGNRKSA
ncbi:hypothetical protein TUM19329_14070 [Legionella antarctica]|uniref:Thioesterase domain-containing protein n=1 Tax=Legionella antarctica TaxID=2708020 RepID=A0A6F8T506_9GAMM|nr:hypothetical protein [Legionella antarctica]BCA95046.1 hypothetical protein TUM19329_14070 [Legionella antarctica]